MRAHCSCVCLRNEGQREDVREDDAAETNVAPLSVEANLSHNRGMVSLISNKALAANLIEKLTSFRSLADMLRHLVL